MRTLRIAPLLLLAGCPLGAKDCTLIGCSSTLLLAVESAGEPVSVFSGEVTVDGTRFDIDCGGDAEPVAGVTCGDGEVSIDLFAVEGGGDVTWTLNSPGSEDPESGLTGGGTITPSWSSSQPNGPDCGPTCWSGEATLELFETP